MLSFIDYVYSEPQAANDISIQLSGKSNIEVDAMFQNTQIDQFRASMDFFVDFSKHLNQEVDQTSPYKIIQYSNKMLKHQEVDQISAYKVIQYNNKMLKHVLYFSQNYKLDSQDIYKIKNLGRYVLSTEVKEEDEHKLMLNNLLILFEVIQQYIIDDYIPHKTSVFASSITINFPFDDPSFDHSNVDWSKVTVEQSASTQDNEMKLRENKFQSALRKARFSLLPRAKIVIDNLSKIKSFTDDETSKLKELGLILQ